MKLTEAEKKIKWQKYLKKIEFISNQFEGKEYTGWWCFLQEEHNIAEDFIRDFQDKINWQYLPMPFYQNTKFSDDFIREFKDKLDWFQLIQGQGYFFSDSIREEFKDKIIEYNLAGGCDENGNFIG